MLQLAEAGALDLDAPVQRYLPDFTLADPSYAARLTIRQLLHQTSGLADSGFPEALLPQPTSLAGRVASLRSAQPVAPPGAEFHYFNPKYAILARIVEVVSGSCSPRTFRHASARRCRCTIASACQPQPRRCSARRG